MVSVRPCGAGASSSAQSPTMMQRRRSAQAANAEGFHHAHDAVSVRERGGRPSREPLEGARERGRTRVSHRIRDALDGRSTKAQQLSCSEQPSPDQESIGRGQALTAQLTVQGVRPNRETRCEVLHPERAVGTFDGYPQAVERAGRNAIAETARDPCRHRRRESIDHRAPDGAHLVLAVRENDRIDADLTQMEEVQLSVAEIRAKGGVPLSPPTPRYSGYRGSAGRFPRPVPR